MSKENNSVSKWLRRTFTQELTEISFGQDGGCFTSVTSVGLCGPLWASLPCAGSGHSSTAGAPLAKRGWGDSNLFPFSGSVQFVDH